MEDSKYIIISLGGSLIVPDAIDTEFVKSFTTLIKEYTNKGFKFAVITGGGKISRKYTDTLKEITVPSDVDLDWVGIAATRLNAELVRVACGDLAYESIIMDPDKVPDTDKAILVGGGWKPGNSHDLAAIHYADSVGAKKVMKLSNIDYAYDKDPKKFPDAVKIEKSSWADFRALLPKDWDPGSNTPFDPIAAEKAESLGLEVVIMNGKNLANIENYLNGEAFVGTVIK
jgi:uridylate kinase